MVKWRKGGGAVRGGEQTSSSSSSILLANAEVVVPSWDPEQPREHVSREREGLALISISNPSTLNPEDWTLDPDS